MSKKKNNKQIDISVQASVRGQETRIIEKPRPVVGDIRVWWRETTPWRRSRGSRARDYHPLDALSDS
ncbi:unnamed protein product [Danaus chrysippus]|uniref:(African queen) hypothetical protein n=1 Tax=Danaus chrysippus TaxID=151541 RepID=A0A8J2MEU6_9NEOP|nr:unnamed protein product [Danaus chrysippus]